MRDWIKSYLTKPAGLRLMERVAREDTKHLSFPLPHQRFAAFNIDKKDIRVVLCGYAPSYLPGVSNGYAFSSNVPTSRGDALIRQVEYSFNAVGEVERNYDFSRWQKQGVFLLNQHLSCRYDLRQPNVSIGWSNLFFEAIDYLMRDTTPKVFILYDNRIGSEVTQIIKNWNRRMGGHHLVLGRGEMTEDGRVVFGRPLLRASQFLREHGRGSISWK